MYFTRGLSLKIYKINNRSALSLIARILVPVRGTSACSTLSNSPFHCCHRYWPWSQFHSPSMSKRHSRCLRLPTSRSPQYQSSYRVAHPEGPTRRRCRRRNIPDSYGDGSKAIY